MKWVVFLAGFAVLGCAEDPLVPPETDQLDPNEHRGRRTVSVLVDASRDGGAWWFPQSSAFDPNAPHQGKPLADYLRSLGFEVTELPRPFTIELSLLQQHDLVIRANESGAFGIYAFTEREAYKEYVRRGGPLLLLGDIRSPSYADTLALLFGMQVQGITRGSQLMDFVPHPITRGVPSGVLRYGVGSGIMDLPQTAKILAHLDGASYLDLNDNGIRDSGEPYAPPVMAIMKYHRGRIVFIGDTNLLEDVPQPLTDNTLRWLLRYGWRTCHLRPGHRCR